jgi:hypothetical protein
LTQLTAALTGAHGVAAHVSGALAQVSAAFSATTVITNFVAALSANLVQVTAGLTGGHGVGGVLTASLNRINAVLSCGHGVAAALTATLEQFSFKGLAGIFQRVVRFLYVLLMGPENRTLPLGFDNRVLVVQ